MTTVEDDGPTGAGPRRRTIAARARRFLRDEAGTSDVEYVLITAAVVLPLFVVPWMVGNANRTVFERLGHWTCLPFP